MSGANLISHWDSATGTIGHFNSYALANEELGGRLGTLVRLGDGRILCLLDYGGDGSMAAVFDTDLTTPSQGGDYTLWYQDVAGAQQGHDAQHSGGIYEDSHSGWNWLTWYPPMPAGDNVSWQYSWCGFDGNGDIQSMMALAGTGDSVAPAWGTNYLLDPQGDYLYRAVEANTGVMDRNSLISSVVYERACVRLPGDYSNEGDPSQFSGLVFVGFTPGGDVVFLARGQNNNIGDMNSLRDKSVIVCPKDLLVWQSWGAETFQDTYLNAFEVVSLIPSGEPDDTVVNVGQSSTLLVIDGHIYYSTIGDYGNDLDTNDAYGNALEFWDLDLATNQIEPLFSVPHCYVFSDGSTTTDAATADAANDPGLVRTSPGAMGLLVGAPAPGAAVDLLMRSWSLTRDEEPSTFTAQSMQTGPTE